VRFYEFFSGRRKGK